MPTIEREASISLELFAKDSASIGLPNDSISFLKALCVWSHLKHLASHVTAKDGRPLLDEDTGVLHMAVERIDSDGSVPHDELPRTGLG